jgi:long-chain acyl-CoA synthetase
MRQNPWTFLEEFRGKEFKDELPTLPELFSITAGRFPDNNCFTVFEPDRKTLSYSEALEKILDVSGYLKTLGVRKGVNVAVSGKNSTEWAVAYCAVLYAGGVIVPLDYQLKNEEIASLIGYADVHTLFIDEEKYEYFQQNKGNIKNLLSLSGTRENYILDLHGDGPWRDESVKLDDLAAILFTSGTTGNPKGVMLTQGNLVNDCFLAQELLTIYSTDIFYALTPLHHSYTMTAVFIEAISVGAELIFAKSLALQQILSDLKTGKVTMLLSIPMLFNKMMKALMKGVREKGIAVYVLIRFLMGISGVIKKVFRVNPGKKMFSFLLKNLSLENNRICICGGGPLPASTFRRFNQLGIDFVQGYGLTETSPIVALNPKEHYKEQSVGKIFNKVEIQIQNPDDQGRGEILLKGPVVMQGYYKNEEETKKVFTSDGFLITGDVGYLDHENYLYLTGRKKSLIVTEGGKNVFPEEIEDYFQLYDEIEQILVKGFVKDEKMKIEGIEAFVYPAPEEEIPENRIDEIIQEVNRQLPTYKRISRFKVLDEPMEMTTTKKIKRFRVRD